MAVKFRTGEQHVFNFLRSYFLIDEEDFAGAISSARKTINGNGSYKKGLFFKAILSGTGRYIDWHLAEEMEDMFVQALN